jgi:hypothetical protein
MKVNKVIRFIILILYTVFLVNGVLVTGTGVLYGICYLYTSTIKKVCNKIDPMIRV